MNKFEEKILEKLDSKSKITKREFDKLCESYRDSDKPLSDYELPTVLGMKQNQNKKRR